MPQELRNRVLIAAGALCGLALAARAARAARQKASRASACIRVAVASKEVHAAVNDAVARAMNAVVTGHVAPSLVADQPVDLEQTLRGARNRIWHVIGTTEAMENYDMVVGIENGILRGGTTGAGAGEDGGGDVDEVWLDFSVSLAGESWALVSARPWFSS